MSRIEYTPPQLDKIHFVQSLCLSEVRVFTNIANICRSLLVRKNPFLKGRKELFPQYLRREERVKKGMKEKNQIGRFT